MGTSEFYFHQSLNASEEAKGLFDLLLFEAGKLCKIDFSNSIEGSFRKWYIEKDMHSAKSISSKEEMLVEFLTQRDITPSVDVHLYHRLDEVDFISGRYYPRIFRPIISPDRAVLFMSPHLEMERLEAKLKMVRDFVPVRGEIMLAGISQLSTLLEELKAICRTVHPSMDNIKVYGSEIRNLLILACTEVEAQLVGIYRANSTNQKERYTTSDYVHLAPLLKLSNYSVRYSLYPFLNNLKPFGEWSTNDPTKSIPWYKDYHSVKHDREEEFNKAHLGNLFNAIVALAILLVAQYGETEPVWRELVGNFFYFNERPFWSYKEHYLPPWKDHDWVEYHAMD